MTKKGTRWFILIWVAVAVAATGLFYLIDPDFQATDGAANSARRLFPFEERELAQVDLYHYGQRATLLRSPRGKWFLHRATLAHVKGAAGGGVGVAAGVHPEPDPEQAAQLQKALDGLVGASLKQRMAPEKPLSAYGLENPDIAAVFYTRAPDGSVSALPIGRLYVGQRLPDDPAYYAQAAGDPNVDVIPREAVDGFIATLQELERQPAASPPPPGNPSPRN